MGDKLESWVLKTLKIYKDKDIKLFFVFYIFLIEKVIILKIYYFLHKYLKFTEKYKLFCLKIKKFDLIMVVLVLRKI